MNNQILNYEREANLTNKSQKIKYTRNTPRQPKCQQIVRGYFSLHDWERVVHVTRNADFLVCIWARNVETFGDGVQITTPPSRFRGRGSTGPYDALVLDVPKQTGMT